MKARALKVFGDGKRLYKEGEVFEVTEEMFERINSAGNGILAEEVGEEAEETEVPEEVNQEKSKGNKPKKTKEE